MNNTPNIKWTNHKQPSDCQEPKKNIFTWKYDNFIGLESVETWNFIFIVNIVGEGGGGFNTCQTY